MRNPSLQSFLLVIKRKRVTLSALETVLSQIADDVNGKTMNIKLLMSLPKIFRNNNCHVFFAVQEK